MPSYLITGVSRGLGLEFLRQLATDKDNRIVGLVRDKSAAESKIEEEIGVLSNVTIVEGDLENYKSLEAAVPVVAEATDGKLDYIIANAGLISDFSPYRTFATMGQTPDILEKDLRDLFNINVIGQVHLLNLFVPLVLAGDIKKVVALTSGHADLELVNEYSAQGTAPYAASKAALNMIMAKFQAEYLDRGVLFLSLAPGFVESTGYRVNDEIKGLMEHTMTKFVTYAPDFQGPVKADGAIKDMLTVISGADVRKPEWRGAFISHKGNKQWL